ncbi:monocarboxylate transporter 12-like isoform X2 [Acanthaster planci]|nr:monocarboxylate transporter 12-like isoform X2 [Acanthaster planci]
MIGMGFLVVSQTFSIYIFGLAMICLTGLGSACVKETTFAEMALYFHEKYALASFVAKLGAPFGMMLYGPLTQLLMDAVGWRGTCMLLGVFSLNIMGCGLLLRRSKSLSRPENQALTVTVSSNGYESLDETREEPRCCSDVIKQMGLDVFRNGRFIFLTLIKYFSGFGYSGFVIYMVPNALALGLEPHEASFTTTAWGLGNLFGLCVTAFAIQKKAISEFAVLGISSAVAIICFALDPHISLFIGQIGVTLIVGAAMESVFLVPVIMTRYLATDDRTVCFFYSWQNFITGLSYPFSGLVSGLMFDNTGSFKSTFLLFSATMTMTAICNVVYHIYTSRSKKKELQS